MAATHKNNRSAVSCLNIFAGNVGAYVARCRQHSKDSTRVLFHVPKTGGTSIRIAMEKELPNFLNITRYADLEKWDDVLQTQLQTPYEMIAGHLRFDALRALYDTETRLSTVSFLREPKSRILSQYRYMVSPKYPYSDDFKAKYQNFETFIKDGVQENPVTRTMFGQCSSLEEALHRASRNFMFIGLTEYSTLHSFIAQACLGLDRFHIPGRANVTVSTEENKVELADDYSKLLEEKCALDIAFYETFREKHVAIFDDVSKVFLSSMLGNQTNLPFQNVGAA